MSLQVLTGRSSLVALGIGVSDIATAISMGRRFGNWMTTASGDEDFLRFLETDELDIIRRRGLIDIVRFNKIWGRQMALLANGKPMVFQGQDAEKNLDKFGRFTAIMVCLVAAMDAFMPSELVRTTLRRILIALVRTTEFGEDVLASRYLDRLNSWRSSGTLRGLATKARQVRRDLQNRKLIVDGLMPQGDSTHAVHFVVWLLTQSTEEFASPSSDVAGMAICLCHLGIDVLSVTGMRDYEMGPTNCRVVFDLEAFLRVHGAERQYDKALLERAPSTTISIECPHEAMTNFPIKEETANRCRMAWIEGTRASETIRCRSVAPDYDWKRSGVDDFRFAFYDNGSRPSRVQDDIWAIASAHAMFTNREVCRGLVAVLQGESTHDLRWIMEQTVAEDDMPQPDDPLSERYVGNINLHHVVRINAFSAFQAFFMGYYYSIFLRLVDTSTLRIPTLDGAWGYRSPTFLRHMRSIWLAAAPRQIHTRFTSRVLSREAIFSILSSLLLGKAKVVSAASRAMNRDSWCVGVIERRALLARSLLRPCRTLPEVGSFIMVDVDTSGIPRDSDGLVRPGAMERPFGEFQIDETDTAGLADHTAQSSYGPAEDITFHIEADWEGDPETMLMCVRSKGRRIETFNPAIADVVFAQCMLKPQSDTQNTSVARVLEESKWKERTGDEIVHQLQHMAGNVLRDLEPEDWQPQPVMLISAENKPRLRYFCAYYFRSNNFPVLVTSECPENVRDRVSRLFLELAGPGRVLISGTEPDCRPSAEDWDPGHVEPSYVKLLHGKNT